MASKTSSYIPNVGGHVPEDKDQWIVHTPYGEGLVIRTRPPLPQNGTVLREIELTAWRNVPIATTTMSNSRTSVLRKPAMLYTAIEYPSIEPTVGAEVICLYGRGKIIDIRYDESDNSSTQKCYVVRISSWRLANRSIVTCYIYNPTAAALRVVRNKKIYEMTVYEKIDKAIELKQSATTAFQQKQYEIALSSYGLAVDTVRYVQHSPSSSNELRADLLNIMITCSNNAATCCYQLNLYHDTMKHAKSADVLIKALQEKTDTGHSKIHAVFTKDGITDIKLFGEWRIKSMILSAKASYQLGNIDDAIDYTKKAKEIMDRYLPPSHSHSQSLSSPTNGSNGESSLSSPSTDTNNNTDPSIKLSYKQLESNSKEIAKIYRMCKEKKKEILQKEKLRARAMFGSPASNDKTTNAVPDTDTVTSAAGGTKTTPVDGRKQQRVITSDDTIQEEKKDSTQQPSDYINKEATGSTSSATTTNNIVSPNTLKKRVTFSERVDSREIPSVGKTSTKAATNLRRSKQQTQQQQQKQKQQSGQLLQDNGTPSKTNDSENDDDDTFDTEAIIGLTLLGVVLGVGITVASSFFMNRGKK